MTTMPAVRLGLNIDHVATLRNARGGFLPDPIRAARLAVEAGVDGITAHLREDRRHIRDDDIRRIMAEIDAPLNLEMAATEEMTDIALKTGPHACCIVPERRQEITTEGGLDVAGSHASLSPVVRRLSEGGIRVSLFIDPEPRQIDGAVRVSAPVVELHTGQYCEAFIARDFDRAKMELRRLKRAAELAAEAGLEVHAGHGLDFETATHLAAFAEIRELNIGHVVIGESVFVGLPAAIGRMRASIAKGVAERCHSQRQQ